MTRIIKKPSQFNLQPGMRVKFDTHSDLGIQEDTIRVVFDQETLMEEGPAAVLTNFSWCWAEDVLEVVEA